LSTTALIRINLTWRVLRLARTLHDRREDTVTHWRSDGPPEMRERSVDPCQGVPRRPSLVSSSIEPGHRTVPIRDEEGLCVPLEVKTWSPLVFTLFIVALVGCKSTGSGMGESATGDVKAHFTWQQSIRNRSHARPMVILPNRRPEPCRAWRSNVECRFGLPWRVGWRV